MFVKCFAREAFFGREIFPYLRNVPHSRIFPSSRNLLVQETFCSRIIYSFKKSTSVVKCFRLIRGVFHVPEIFFVREVFIGREIFEKLSIIFQQTLTSRELSTSQNILNRKWKLILSNCSSLRTSVWELHIMHPIIMSLTSIVGRIFGNDSFDLQKQTCTSFKFSRKACILPLKLTSSYVDFIPKSFIRISCYWMWFSL